MKLIIAIVNSDDVGVLTGVLNKKGYSVTRLSTTGGFLRVGNVTLMIGVEEDEVQLIMDIIKDKCQTRKQIATTSAPMTGLASYPVEVEVSGAITFVIDVERFEKL